MPRRRARDERGGATRHGRSQAAELDGGVRPERRNPAAGGQAVKPMSSYWRSKKPRAPTLASVARTATICGRW